MFGTDGEGEDIMQERTQVLVTGGGYAGATAANRLAGRGGVDVALVNARPVFVERIRLHQLAAGSDDAVVPYADVLAPHVRLVVDVVTRIDAAGRRVVLASGEVLAYDYLVYAVGSGSPLADVPGAAEHAHPVAELPDAERLRRALAAAGPDAPVAVVGAGPAGIEVAAELAERGRIVTLLCGGPLGPSLHPRARRAVARRLDGLGVRVQDGPGSRAVAVGPDEVTLDDGRSIPSAVTIWTTGFSLPALARDSGLTVDAAGRLLTDETLTSIDDDRIVAAGDAAAPSGAPLRMSCQAAGPLGGAAGDTVVARIRGERPKPFTMAFVGLCLSLGRTEGVIQFAHRDDSPTRVSVDGRAGARVKEFICRLTVSSLRMEARHPGATRLPAAFGDPARRRSLAFATAETAASGGRG